MKKHNIQSVFYVTTKGFDRPGGKERVKMYAKAGHLLANHTHTHPNYRKTKIVDYMQDFNMAHNKLKDMPNFMKWFRYPFLREGESIVKRDAMRNHLYSHEYINGYVTVDNYDYYINHLVQKSLKEGQEVDLEKACRMYSDLLWEGTQYYDNLAKTHIGKIKHVLLMHENDLAAHCLEDLITLFKNNNWKIINPVESYLEPKLQRDPNTLYLGQGRVAAYVHEKTGVKFRSQWENKSKLEVEFNKREIVQ